MRIARSFVALLAVAAACGGSPPVTGTLSNGLDGKPLGGQRVLAKAKGGDLTCQVREATTSPEGAFTLEKLCSEVEYTLSLGDKELRLADAGAVQGGAPATLALTAWRAPTGEGVYRLEGDKLTPIKVFADVKSAALASGATVRYPALKPTKLPAVAAGQKILLVSKKSADALQIVPLVSDPATRTFGDGSTIQDHVWIGTRFVDDATLEPVTATVDAAKVKDGAAEGAFFRYVDSDAVPAGAYAILGPEDKRTWAVEFGKAAEGGGEAAPPANP
jgi:hypothetical protein